MSEKAKPKKSTVRHTRAIQRDRTKRPNTAPPDDQIEARLTELAHPATLNQVAHFHDLGLRERLLNLPVMMAFVKLKRTLPKALASRIIWSYWPYCGATGRASEST